MIMYAILKFSFVQVSLVLDRILLLVFFLAMTIASFVILTSSPHLYSFIDMISLQFNENSSASDSDEYEILQTFDEVNAD